VKGPQPPSGPAAPAAPRGTNLAPTLSLMNDPATSTQYERQATQLAATLQSQTGFTAQAARDTLPSVFAHLQKALAEGGEPAQVLHDPFVALLQRCGQPMVCTTLQDQRALVDAMEGMMSCVADVLAMASPVLRVTAATVLRQVFSNIRAQCYDDLNRNPHVTFHKKRDVDRALTPSLVRQVMAAWNANVETNVTTVVDNARKPAAAISTGASSDDDEVDAARVATPIRAQGYEMIVVMKAALELSSYKRLCEVVIAERGIELAVSTLRLCVGSDQRIPLAVEFLWNLLSLCPECSVVIGSRSNLAAIHNILTETLALGFKLQERELRNDIMVVLTLLARSKDVGCNFSTELIELLLILGCGPESGRKHPNVNPTLHATTQNEDLQLKYLVWDTLAALAQCPELAGNIFDWGFYDVLLAYVNVNCEIPAVVSWSTLQVLELQSHVLRLLHYLMDRGSKWFSSCSGPATLRVYIDDAPKVELRNQALAVLTAAASTPVRVDLIDVGAIPLAIHLLESTSDLDLRINCLNLLGDVVRRVPSLQRQFDDHDGIRVLLPLLNLRPDEYTDLLDAVIFAAVDCVWQCVFGSDSNERHFVESGGVDCLLGVLESAPSWMVSLPLSCLADLLIHPSAAVQCRSWRSPRTGRSGVQIALGLWHMSALENVPAPESIASNLAIGLEAVGVNAHKTLPSTMQVPRRESVRGDINLSAFTMRDDVRDPPADIAHIVATQRTNFKVFAMLAVLGFEGHSELDANERATLAAIESFIALCKDEIWQNVEASLIAEGIVPIDADRAVLDQMRVEATARSTQLLATRRTYSEIHDTRTAESERTFYKSLIKKTEERTVASQKPMGLSITEAKIRKAQMLKASFKQAVNSATTSQTEGALDRDRKEQFFDTKSGGPTQPAEVGQQQDAHTDRWDPGQREMHESEHEILRVLNEVRTNPESLIPAIEEKLKYLDETGSRFYVPGCDPENCQEGEAAYREAIDFLRQVRPLVTLLDVPTGMVFAARDHVADLGGRMDVSADGSDRSTPQTRLQRYGRVGRFAHLTSVGQRTPVGIVMQLVVDDGVTSRIDRQSVFDPDARCCGLSVGPHSIQDTVAVVLLAHEFHEKTVTEQRETHEQVLHQHASRK
jgi:hypothetical protein